MHISSKDFLLNNKILGHIAFLILGCLAVIFYLERTIFVDPAYAAFNITYYKNFVSEAGRYAAVLPQALPLLAISLHLPLKIVLCLYSLSFILLYYLIFLIIAYWFKNDTLTLAVPLVLMLGIKYSFFWISTETHQTLVYSLLFVGFLFYSLGFKPGIISNFKKILVASAILLLCFFTHPVSLFTVLFILGYVMIDQKLWKKPIMYFLGVLIVTIAIIKVLTAQTNGYEGYIFQGFLAFFEKIGYWKSSESFIFLTKKVYSLYLFSSLIFIATVVYYAIKKQYLKLAYYVLAILTFLLIIFATFDVWFLQFIEEKNFMPLNIFLLVPFLKDVVFSSNRLNLAKQFFLILLFTISVANVVSASSFYKDRLAYISSLINQTKRFPEKKFIISEKLIDRSRLEVPWSLGPETLLLSSLKSPDSSRSIFILESNVTLNPEIDLKDSLRFLCTSWAQNLEVNKMDKQYYNLDNSSFRIITINDLYHGVRKIGYVDLFNDPSMVHPGSHYEQDSSGNEYYVLTDEYSPGFYGKFTEMTSEENVYLSATVRVFPLEGIDPKALNLVISREQGSKIFDYYMSYSDKAGPLKPNFWNTLTVSGVVRSTDKNDLLKIYVWNPGKKKVRMDDLVIYYDVNQSY
ncbi:MAG: hypothetical protein M0P58_13435 [Bacteroidales bacterium]|nr:hypothetical protein [Bacteroidales bacterium]